jgi:AraC-like DNA-binding protein
MRIQRAAEKLANCRDKIETIAHEVGYESLFTFSNTFQRLLGCRPSAYRNGGGGPDVKTNTLGK